jgi:hypothetical protein
MSKDDALADDFDDFLNSRLDDEQTKELESLLDEAPVDVLEKKNETEVLESATPTTPSSAEKMKKTEEKPKINRNLKTKEIKKMNNILENENQITIEFPNTTTITNQEDLTLDEIQNQKIEKLMNSSIDTDELLQKRFNKMIQETALKFGKLVKIENVKEEMKQKLETFSQEDKIIFDFMNSNIQEKLIILERTFEILNQSLEKSIKKQISIKTDKKKLREMYFEKESSLKEVKEKYLKLDEKFADFESKMTHENEKLKRERDLLIKKLSKYEVVDELEIEKESTPFSESITNIFKEQSWFSSWGSSTTTPTTTPTKSIMVESNNPTEPKAKEEVKKEEKKEETKKVETSIFGRFF